MKTPNLNKLFGWTVSIQFISAWTILIAASYVIGEVWLDNKLSTYLILWFLGALGLGRIVSWYYTTETKEKDKEGGQISNLIYRAIVETSPDSVAATDLLGNYIFANKQTAVLHGYASSEEFIGKSALSHFPTNNVSKALRYMT